MADRNGASSRARRPECRSPVAVHVVVPVVTALAVLLAGAGGASAGPRAIEVADVIVREAAGHHADAVRSVERLGGQPGRRLSLVESFEAHLPARATAALRRAPGVSSVTPNAALRLSGSSDAGAATIMPSITDVARSIGATALWNNDVTGEGVDVALLDSGVVPVNGLTASGKVVNGPDLSFERQVALSWSGLSWSGVSWSGLSWSGLSWSGTSWSGLGWSTIEWSSP